jgi:hypothetical protein
MNRSNQLYEHSQLKQLELLNLAIYPSDFFTSIDGGTLDWANIDFIRSQVEGKRIWHFQGQASTVDKIFVKIQYTIITTFNISFNGDVSGTVNTLNASKYVTYQYTKKKNKTIINLYFTVNKQPFAYDLYIKDYLIFSCNLKVSSKSGDLLNFTTETLGAYGTYEYTTISCKTPYFLYPNFGTSSASANFANLECQTTANPSYPIFYITQLLGADITVPSGSYAVSLSTLNPNGTDTIGSYWYVVCEASNLGGSYDPANLSNVFLLTYVDDDNSSFYLQGLYYIDGSSVSTSTSQVLNYINYDTSNKNFGFGSKADAFIWTPSNITILSTLKNVLFQTTYTPYSSQTASTYYLGLVNATTYGARLNSTPSKSNLDNAGNSNNNGSYLTMTFYSNETLSKVTVPSGSYLITLNDPNNYLASPNAQGDSGNLFLGVNVAVGTSAIEIKTPYANAFYSSTSCQNCQYWLLTPTGATGQTLSSSFYLLGLYFNNGSQIVSGYGYILYYYIPKKNKSTEILAVNQQSITFGGYTLSALEWIIVQK